MDRHRDKKDQKFQRKALQVQEAQARVMQYAKPLGSEEVPLSQSCGRVLAEPLTAPHPFPAFNRSGMDGYAVIAADTAACSTEQPVWLAVVDNIPCGSVPSAELTSGTAARIMTGAQVPEGADAVVMVEITETKEMDGQVYVGLRKPQQAGSNITPQGFELKESEQVLPAGRCISAGDIAVLAAFGVPMVTVHRRPKVAVFATGSELLEVDEPLQPGKIRNSNSPMLEALVREAGGEAVMLGAIADDLELARSRVQMALETHDLVITTGESPSATMILWVTWCVKKAVKCCSTRLPCVPEVLRPQLYAEEAAARSVRESRSKLCRVPSVCPASHLADAGNDPAFASGMDCRYGCRL